VESNETQTFGKKIKMSKSDFNIHVISDPHIGHDNEEGGIIAYCKRPFQNIQDMDEKLTTFWNATVRPIDMVICLGDFVWTKGLSEVIKERIKKLNGRIILVRGNHDKKSNMWYMSNGVQFICDRFVWDYNGKRVLFIHNPDHITSDDYTRYDFILHGHCHNNVPFMRRVGKVFLVNLSVEHTKYRPMPLIPLLNRLAQGYYDKTGA
jgi:calcineurin-like phosphoesterase family protein